MDLEESRSNRFFYGDGRDGENPQAYMKLVKRRMRGKTLTESAKVEMFEEEMYPGSDAENWYEKLESTVKVSWAEFETAFNTQWPPATQVPKTKEEKQQELMDTVLKDEEIGVRVRVSGMDELGHVRWANKVMRLATAVGDTGGFLITPVRERMPKVMRTLVKGSFADWKGFTDAVKAVSASDIVDAKENEMRLQRLETPSPRSSSFNHQSFTRPSFQTNSPITTAALANLRNSFNLHNSASTFSSTVPAMAGATPQSFAASATTRTIAHRWADVLKAINIPAYPNTPEGRAKYNTDVLAYNARRGDQPINEFRPHPLSPGTNPIASGECWTCGRSTNGHIGSARMGGCQDKNPVPEGEQRWRMIAATIKKQALAAGVVLQAVGSSPGGPATASVYHVGAEGRWLEDQAYHEALLGQLQAQQEEIARYEAEAQLQGKGQGSST